MDWIGIGELAIRTLCGEIGNALGIVEGQGGIAEITMQQRPQRIVVVDDAGGRQTRAQGIQAVPDQRGNDDRINRVLGKQFAEQATIARVVHIGIGNGAGQGNAAQRRSVERSIVQFKPFAVTPALMAAAGFQDQVIGRREGTAEIAYPTFGTTAPAMQDMQDHRSCRQRRAGRCRRRGQCHGELRAQSGQCRRRQRIARVRALPGTGKGVAAGTDITMIEHDRAPCARALGQALAMPGRCQRRDFAHLDQSMARMGVAKRVDVRDIRFAEQARRQGRACRIEIVQRAGGKHIGLLECAQQARQCQRWQFGIAAHDQQVPLRQAQRQCPGQRLGGCVGEIAKAQRLAVPVHRRRCPEQDKGRAFRHLRHGCGQPGVGAGECTMHAEAGGFRQGFQHDKRLRIIGDAGAHCHGGARPAGNGLP